MVNGAPPPDINAQLLQLQSLIASGNNNGRGAPILLGFGDVDCFSGLSLKGKGLNADKTLPTLVGAGKPKLADKLLQALMGVADDLKKINQGGGVIYSGDLPSGSLPGGGGNGSFASLVSSRSDSGLDIT